MRRNNSVKARYIQPCISTKHIPIALFSSHISGIGEIELLAQCYGHASSCGGCSIGCICGFPCGQNCLPGSTTISTVNGNIPISKLGKDDYVWSMNKKGQKILVPIKFISHIHTNPYHEVTHLKLSDGRCLYASKRHPTVNGCISELEYSGYYDGAKIESIQTIPYFNKTTYDLLPDSDTGFYWANNILIGSSLKNVYNEYFCTIPQIQ